MAAILGAVSQMFGAPPAAAAVSHVYLYPIKSCGGISVPSAQVTPQGLVGDRQWVVVELESGRFVTQRECPSLVRVLPRRHADGGLTLTYETTTVGVPAPQFNANPHFGRVTVWGDTVLARAVSDECDAFFSAIIGKPARLYQLHEERPVDGGAHPGAIAFADGYPLLIVNDASVAELNTRLKNPVSHVNFRPNVVVSAATPAYAEDRWARIAIGNDLVFECPKPCGRCSMPSINPVTGERAADAQPLILLRKFRSLGDNGCFGINAMLDNGSRTGVISVGMPLHALVFQSSPFS